MIDWATNKFDEIYLKGTDEFIRKILEIARSNFGDGCRIIDLEPQLKERDDEDDSKKV